MGDSYECDVCGVAEAGMVPIWYDPRDQPPRPPAAAQVPGWPDFLALLDAASQP